MNIQETRLGAIDNRGLASDGHKAHSFLASFVLREAIEAAHRAMDVGMMDEGATLELAEVREGTYGYAPALTFTYVLYDNTHPNLCTDVIVCNPSIAGISGEWRKQEQSAL